MQKKCTIENEFSVRSHRQMINPKVIFTNHGYSSILQAKKEMLRHVYDIDIDSHIDTNDMTTNLVRKKNNHTKTHYI